MSSSESPLPICGKMLGLGPCVLPIDHAPGYCSIHPFAMEIGEYPEPRTCKHEFRVLVWPKSQNEPSIVQCSKCDIMWDVKPHE